MFALQCNLQLHRRPGAVARKAPQNNAASAGGGTGQWRFYQDDAPGLKVGPVPVLILSLLFIASVFMLHIWGKFSRG
jgi:protein transport protein SEC61 subunit beta